MKYVALVLTALAIFATEARAGTIKGNIDNCTYLARTVQQVAEVRDAGMPWEEAGPQLQQSLTEALGNADSYVKDAEDAEYVFKQLKAVWHEWKDLPPSHVGVRVLIDCSGEKNTKPYRRAKVKLT